jgi:hypothetical protein
MGDHMHSGTNGLSSIISGQVDRVGHRKSGLLPALDSSAGQIAAVGLATLIGLGFRLYRLAAAPLSSQEVYTWDFSHQTVPFILGPLSHVETNPPLYFLLMKFVMRIGEAEFILRLPSVIAGTLAIPLLYILGRLGGASKGGTIGAGLLSLSAIAISYSREARTYALLQAVCLIAAIGVVILINHYTGAGLRSARPARREFLGWLLLTVASIVGFYLHYTFGVEIVTLECGLVAAIGIGWLSGKVHIDWALIAKWLASLIVISLCLAWGVALARSLAQSANIAEFQVPSPGGAARLFMRVDGYSNIARFQPLPNLLLIGLAVVGLVVGWRRSAAVLVSGTLFALFPLLLFVISQNRPIFIERSLVAPSFAVCLLAGCGTMFLVGKLSELGSALFRHRATGFENASLRSALSATAASAAFAILFGLALISATNTIRNERALEPYDKATEYLASVMKPGDVAVGTDGVIYYRQRIGAGFPYFKLVEGDASVARVTYGSSTVRTDQVAQLASADHWVYLVLRHSIGLVVQGQSQPSYASYVLHRLGYPDAPTVTFGSLSIYRMPGKCTVLERCLGAPPA